MEFLAQVPRAEKKAGYYAHRLLRVVAAVAEAVSRRRDELPLTEDMVHLPGRGPPEEVIDDDAQDQSQDHTDHGRNKNERNGL